MNLSERIASLQEKIKYAEDNGENVRMTREELTDVLTSLRCYERCLEETCDDDEEIRNICRPVIGDEYVNGDSHMVPSTPMCVRETVEKLSSKLAQGVDRHGNGLDLWGWVHDVRRMMGLHPLKETEPVPKCVMCESLRAENERLKKEVGK